MRQILLSVSLGAAMLLLPGCWQVIPVMAANIGAQAAIGSGMNKAKADKCYAVTRDNQAKKLDAAASQRALTTAGC